MLLISDQMSTTYMQRVVQAAIDEAVQRGFVRIVASDDGVVRYQITELGEKYFQGVLDWQEEK